MKRRSLLFLFLFLVILIIPQPVKAQDNVSYPQYIVQSGETLTEIANKFNVAVDDLIKVNNLSNPDIISEGTRLNIPGLQGINGILTTQSVEIGQSLDSFVRTYQANKDFIIKVNKKTSPSEIYAGSNLIIPVDDAKVKMGSGKPLQSGQSLLEKSIIQQTNPWSLIENNNIKISANIIPSEFIFSPSSTNSQTISQISPQLKEVDISPLPLVQGNTIVAQIISLQPVELNGTLDGNNLNFFQTGENEYTALQGINAMATTGLAPLLLKGNFNDGSSFAFEQSLLLTPGVFAKDPPFQVPDEMIDPAVTKPEDDFVLSIVKNVSPEKYWDSQFSTPVDQPVCFKSYFGTRRSYNGSDYTYFHSGLDYGVCATLNIYVAAPGKVVYTGLLTVRGNATFIDHGEGVYTGYFHQSEIKVKVGDEVKQGQLIGIIGATGRVTGPHLHFEVWVGGMQVNPLEWLNKNIP